MPLQYFLHHAFEKGAICIQGFNLTGRPLRAGPRTYFGHRQKEKNTDQIPGEHPARLKKSGVLESKKGKGGGYFISKNPSKVSIASIIRIVDGPIAMLPCVSLYFYEKCKNCDEFNCGLHEMMEQVRDATLNILEHRTLHDLASGRESIPKK